MGESADLTLEILKQIRDAVQQTNARLDQTREELVARLDQTNARLDQTREELVARLDQTNARLDQHERLLVRVAEESVVHSRALVRLIDEAQSLNARIDRLLTGPLGATVRDHDARIAALEVDVAALKRKAG